MTQHIIDTGKLEKLPKYWSSVHKCYMVRAEDVRALLSNSPQADDVRKDAWLPIETAPKNGERVLVWNKNWYDPSTASFYGTDWRLIYELGTFVHQPTHWQPLPAPPLDKARE